MSKKPVHIGKTKIGTFKLVYEHPNQKSKDIYLIIRIINKQEITLKTTYLANRSRGLEHMSNQPFNTIAKNMINVPEMNIICTS